MLLDVALVLLNEYIMMIMMTVEHGPIKCVAYSEKKTKLCCVFLAFCTVCFSVSGLWSRSGLGLCANYILYGSTLHFTPFMADRKKTLTKNEQR